MASYVSFKASISTIHDRLFHWLSPRKYSLQIHLLSSIFNFTYLLKVPNRTLLCKFYPLHNFILYLNDLPCNWYDANVSSYDILNYYYFYWSQLSRINADGFLIPIVSPTATMDNSRQRIMNCDIVDERYLPWVDIWNTWNEW